MLLSIKLDADRSGHISELANDVDRRKICELSTVFTGLIPVAIRTKANKVANNHSLKDKTDNISFGQRKFVVMANGSITPGATLLFDINTGMYEIKVHPAERKRGMIVELEVSVQTPKKATA